MVAVIGDIHGCFNTLKSLFEKIKEIYPDILIYSVGDLVDRGKYSYEVVDFIVKNQITFTAGNHDLMFYYFISKPAHPIGKSWIYNGSETTMASYENKAGKIREHLAIIKKAPLFLNTEDCFISHAGISSFYHQIFDKNILNEPDRLNQILLNDINSSHGVIWTRDELMDLGKLQIVGHTRKKEVFFNKRNNSLYIDTAAFSGNKLTAVVIDKSEIVDTLYVGTLEDDLVGYYSR